VGRAWSIQFFGIVLVVTEVTGSVLRIKRKEWSNDKEAGAAGIPMKAIATRPRERHLRDGTNGESRFHLCTIPWTDVISLTPQSVRFQHERATTDISRHPAESA
jgi:hypothetical protein